MVGQDNFVDINIPHKQNPSTTSTKDIITTTFSKPSPDGVLQSIQSDQDWELLLDCFCCSRAEPVVDTTTKLIANYGDKGAYFNNNNLQDDDDISFGSISTKGSMCSSNHTEGRLGGPFSIMRTSSTLMMRPSILKRQDSQHSRKSARFNDEMNQTVEYDDSLNFLEYCQDDNDFGDTSSVGAKSTRSAGGQARYLTPSKSMKLRNDQRFDASVVGTCSKDDSVHPRILNLYLMDAFQAHLPLTKRSQLFWLKYSMVRDGASMHTLMQKTQSSQYNIIAIETIEGEVFGAFTSQPWAISANFYGTAESFLWRWTRVRDASRSSPSAKQTMEVFPFAGNNLNIQLCTPDNLSVGGGHPDETSVKDYGDIKMSDWGFGISIGEDMQRGTSSPCITFESPSLSKLHKDGSFFEISNIEVWSLTPCNSLQQATQLEQTKRLIQRCRTF